MSASASKDHLNSSIYLRALTISQQARSNSQISSYAPPPLAEVKQVNASFQPDPHAKGLLSNIDSTFTFTKVLEPVRTSEGAFFNDYGGDNQGNKKKPHRHRKNLSSLVSLNQSKQELTPVPS